MIARTWHGRSDAARAPDYVEYLRRNVIPELKAIAGFRGIDVMQREENGSTHFTVMTLWASMDAIRAFAGDDPTIAVVEPEARAVLTQFDDRVQHHDVVIHDAG